MVLVWILNGFGMDLVWRGRGREREGEKEREEKEREEKKRGGETT